MLSWCPWLCVTAGSTAQMLAESSRRQLQICQRGTGTWPGTDDADRRCRLACDAGSSTCWVRLRGLPLWPLCSSCGRKHVLKTNRYERLLPDRLGLSASANELWKACRHGPTAVQQALALDTPAEGAGSGSPQACCCPGQQPQHRPRPPALPAEAPRGSERGPQSSEHAPPAQAGVVSAVRWDQKSAQNTCAGPGHR